MVGFEEQKKSIKLNTDEFCIQKHWRLYKMYLCLCANYIVIEYAPVSNPLQKHCQSNRFWVVR